MAEDTEQRSIGNVTVKIDRGVCIGSGNCTKTAPEVFELDEETIATFVNEVGEIDRERLLESCRVCPVDALYAYDQDGNQLV